MKWKTITPETVTKAINFNATKDENWRYDEANNDSMAAKQTEGVAYLWNLLSKHKIALLADEVGTGKTFQALAVAALLWQQKPHARVLVVAPNTTLCTQWRNEYETFVRKLYKQVDHKVKSCVNDKPVQGMEIAAGLEDLAEIIQRATAHMYFVTIHAFSHLSKKEAENKTQCAAEQARKIHEKIKKAPFCEEGFDLVIVDEAHYLRNKNGGSQRTAAAQAFFQNGHSQLAQKVLLLTATPNHTNKTDIANILSYFVTSDYLPFNNATNDAQKLMQTFGLRRLRVLSVGEGDETQNFDKYEYRDEQALPATFANNPKAEAFFAIYQKRLVSELEHSKEKRHLTYGYLEGFESFGRDVEKLDADNQQAKSPSVDSPATGEINEEAEEANGEENGEQSKEAFSRALDTELLQSLTASYREKFKTFPQHPKYRALVYKCVPDAEELINTPSIEDLKHLIFVRRIPSLRELTQRMNECYDKKLATLMFHGWAESSIDKLVESNYKRDVFAEIIKQVGKADIAENLDVDPENDDNQEANKGNESLASAVAQLFVVKRDLRSQSDAANVKLRFIKNESIYSLFFEPAVDYKQAGYFYHYRSEDTNKRALYKSAAQDARYKQTNDSDLLSEIAVSKQQNHSEAHFNAELTTCWGLVYAELTDAERKQLATWQDKTPKIVENFSNYIRAGFLYASPVFIEVYAWFKTYQKQELNNHLSAENSYQGFCEFVKPKLPNSLLLKYFKAALNTFEMLCEKIVGHKLDDWKREWTQLKSQTNPVWFASGDTAASTRESLKLGFNSPFYPHVLIATSVFKEGVNLHLNCHQVHHYGLAGSAGDNEQRVGRVDRMYGSLNRRLGTGDGTLKILYPYLAASIDEDQVASFIRRKRDVENQLDKCLQDQADDVVHQEETASWQHLLHKPVRKSVHASEPHDAVDPYPATFDGLLRDSAVSEQQTEYTSYTRHDITSLLETLLTNASAANLQATDEKSEWLFKLERQLPATQDTTERYQPIFVKLDFSAAFSAVVPDTAYIVRLASPIASKDTLQQVTNRNWPKIVTELTKHYPLVRAVLNNEAQNSHFYLSAVCELPLFANDRKLGLLSQAEITLCLQQLEAFADALEHALFDGLQDLRMMDVQTGTSVRGRGETGIHNRNADFSEAEWRKYSLASGDVEIIQAVVDLETLKGMLGKHKLAMAHIAMHCNSLFPFINFVADDTTGDTGKVTAQIAFPSVDFNEEERGVLKAWFNIIC
ncbi:MULTISPECIES: DEAD/DEAH box helicase [Pseudidiomarina]|uniref:Helicase-like protein n=2 Tax=Pseudidiomarina TaxID=2800384 RepID=A0A368UNS2_9GAMM|nr:MULTISPECIES: DEAD/DEAH box helicase [Pseudidiomarina]PWW11205.1 helicase-like protein [Pseudidiomarina maritima]RBP88495.1 helicase-like protein [Pseudidiomarina tainanensis]RCW30447.1 helicase-like protein [Pseudidiomarina tainanensis]